VLADMKKALQHCRDALGDPRAKTSLNKGFDPHPCYGQGGRECNS
jgi:hypothetical protein